ncbi:hypothetical protein GALMADRAFT_795858 [Galerina marginata CBS 339.88]|uniref:Deoxyribonuclease NucA/NucB domain-containing protein n=1 Tax=Galerina marginata (strain CBS 339.88) TaxID=685588 RepID=A0A067SWS3_GALM3|nr:hypothetical protein GALMADRAFT_795858 [Galerina marginata CBS 339.88]
MHLPSNGLKSKPKTGKSGSWVIHVERTPSSRRDSECAGYNRCSHGRACGAPPGGWLVNPNAGKEEPCLLIITKFGFDSDWSCDEQPKSSTHEGGLGSATRCMPKGENSGEGANWQNFINGNSAATNHVRLLDGQAVTVVLRNANHGGYCASYGGTGATQCGSAASPPGTNNGPRQR